ncbi:EamA family transporter [Rouxiella sp. Mn2063]|uniref:EamA family transporter n=1 Tax=Rouxiella sp. Mn2063 TaxID=3395262 RepID=UPI003BE83394
MSQLTLILWVLNILTDTAGQLAFKAAAQNGVGYSGLAQWRQMMCHPWLWIGMGSYVLEFVVWLAFLSLVPLSLGMMLGSINIVVIMIGGRLFFKEVLSPWSLLGIVLIACGVAVVGIE